MDILPDVVAIFLSFDRTARSLEVPLVSLLDLHSKYPLYSVLSDAAMQYYILTKSKVIAICKQNGKVVDTIGVFLTPSVSSFQGVNM